MLEFRMESGELRVGVSGTTLTLPESKKIGYKMDGVYHGGLFWVVSKVLSILSFCSFGLSKEFFF